MLRRVALVRADVSEEHSAPIIRVTRIGEQWAVGTRWNSDEDCHTELADYSDLLEIKINVPSIRWNIIIPEPHWEDLVNVNVTENKKTFIFE
jgi:uncharacterized protein (DUF736 family)